jgi:cytosine/adenosine deaminase-related metal-dependent hydrolase
VADLFEEARLVELHERLVTGRRGQHPPADLLAAATGGAALRPGAEADLCAVDPDGVRPAGIDLDDPVPMLVAAATAADVTDVVVGGRHVVRGGVHRGLDVAAALRAAIAAVR